MPILVPKLSKWLFKNKLLDIKRDYIAVFPLNKLAEKKGRKSLNQNSKYIIQFVTPVPPLHQKYFCPLKK